MIYFGEQNLPNMFDMQKNEVKFLYNSSKKDDREAYAYAISLKKHKINELDVSKTKLTRIQLAQLATKLNVPIIELFDQKSSYYRDEVEGRDWEENDLLLILTEEADALKTPIMVYADKAVCLDSKYDTNKIDLAIEGIKNSDKNK